ncbi:MAG TPA: uracil-DNA glycosylase [Blastocatellia bacterium]|nr:uracil-DNA glycosylase [Blastocatellia bacterium]
MENQVRMSKEIIEEISNIARQLEEQLKFYREIGVTDIGGAAHSLQQAPGAVSEAVAHTQPPVATPTARAQIQTHNEESMPKKKEQVQQAGLFGDLSTDEGAKPASRNVALPLLHSQDASLEAIREDIGECTRCKLHEHRTKIVYGEGNPKAQLVFIGEGPGADEDATGRPFVGRAGQLLDKIIAAIGLKRDDIYIANVVKCRPPGNRTPERDEVATCEQFLFRQLAFIQPKIIVALGSPAFQCLLRTKETITRARGNWRDWNGIKVMPTFHPAYLLRSPEKKREAWDDMKKVRDYLSSLPD